LPKGLKVAKKELRARLREIERGKESGGNALGRKDREKLEAVLKELDEIIRPIPPSMFTADQLAVLQVAEADRTNEEIRKRLVPTRVLEGCGPADSQLRHGKSILSEPENPGVLHFFLTPRTIRTLCSIRFLQSRKRRGRDTEADRDRTAARIRVSGMAARQTAGVLESHGCQEARFIS